MIRGFSALAVVGVIAFAVPAAAQMGPPPGEGPHWGGPPRAEMEKKFAEMRAQRARDMHVILRLRADQEPAWQAYEAALAPPPRGERPHGPPPATTPERLDAMDGRMKEMAARRAKVDSATRAFYAALNPEQQQVFDALQRLHGPHGPGGGGPRGFRS